MGVLQVPEGEDIVEFLKSAAAPEGTWISGVGILTALVLATPADGGEVVREIPGRTQLLSLGGATADGLMVVIAPTGSAVEGGRLLSGRSAGVALFVFEPVAALPRAPKPLPARATQPDGDDDEADEAPRYGDRVEHFVFGLCDVMVVREERMKIRASSGGKLREIHLGAVKVLKPTVEDGRRVFKLVRK